MSFLGVETSLTQRRWVGPSAEEDRLAEAMAQLTGLADAVCRVLARFRIPAEEAQAYLAPALRDLLPDPHSLRDMEPAARRFLEAVRSASGSRSSPITTSTAGPPRRSCSPG